MEKLAQYQRILSEFVEEFANAPFSVQTQLQNQAVTDTIHNHFQVVTMGWDKGQFVFDIVLHFDIKDNKIWIQQNWTDILLDQELVKRGVAATDIKVGFLSQYA